MKVINWYVMYDLDNGSFINELLDDDGDYAYTYGDLLTEKVNRVDNSIYVHEETVVMTWESINRVGEDIVNSDSVFGDIFARRMKHVIVVPIVCDEADFTQGELLL